MNKNKCVVCNTALVKKVKPKWVESTGFENVVLEIYCPECQLVYKVVDEKDTQTIGAD